MSLISIKVNPLIQNEPSALAKIHNAVNPIKGVTTIKVFIDQNSIKIEYENSEATQRRIVSEVKAITLSSDSFRITNEFGDILDYL